MNWDDPEDREEERAESRYEARYGRQIRGGCFLDPGAYEPMDGAAEPGDAEENEDWDEVQP